MDKLTEKQVKEFRDAFRLFDKDGDGAITTKEIGTVMRSLGQDPSEGELEEMVREVDVDGNGIVEFEEFLELMAKKLKGPDSTQELKDVFDVFDRNGNGAFGHEELKVVMMNMGERITDAEAATIIRELDISGEGDIRF